MLKKNCSKTEQNLIPKKIHSWALYLLQEDKQAGKHVAKLTWELFNFLLP